MEQHRNRPIIVIAAIFVVALIGSLLFLALQHRGEVSLHIVAAPQDSSITIDGKASSVGTAYVKKGSHTIKASRQYFTTVTETINTSDLLPGQKIYLLPGADTPEAIKYLNEHPDVETFREAVAAARTTARAQTFAQYNPVVSGLPHRTLDYKIDYEPKGDRGIRFVVTLYPVATTPGTAEYDQQISSFKAEALEYLKNQGTDVQKADIEYRTAPS